jgi:hypothetical protein
MHHTVKISREGKFLIDSAIVTIESFNVPNGFQGMGGCVLEPSNFSPLSGNYQLHFDDGRRCDIVFLDNLEFRVNGCME